MNQFYSDALNVMLVVEIHGGLSSNAQWLAGVMKLADNETVGTWLERVRQEPG